MLQIPGYQITENIYESSNSRIYRGKRIADRRPIMLKMLHTDYPSPEQVVQFNNEYELTNNLPINGIRHALETIRTGSQYALILEYIPGHTLKQAFVEQRQSLSEILKVAIQIAQILGDIHHHNIIHKDLNSNNILVNADTRLPTIIDFGIASKITLKIPHLSNPDKLEGTLAYISPEQTGRMNRVVDYRTDLYSFGVMLYELLTGNIPFDTEDAMEIVHCHIAKNPIPPCDVNPDIPKILSQVVMKLMAKNAEDRYQSAFGVKHDLEWCLKNLSGLEDLAGSSVR